MRRRLLSAPIHRSYVCTISMYKYHISIGAISIQFNSILYLSSDMY